MALESMDRNLLYVRIAQKKGAPGTSRETKKFRYLIRARSKGVRDYSKSAQPLVSGSL
jgi:hypothetical protein